MKLFHLLQVTDSSFPIGAFSHSYGLETYTQQEIVKDENTSKQFLENTLQYNTHFNDAAFVTWAFQYGLKNDLEGLLKLDREVSALKTIAEIRVASRKLSIRFLKIIDNFDISTTLLKTYAEAIHTKQTEGHYALVFALYGHCLGISLADVLTAFYYNTASGIVTNCAKLIPLSQMTGQRLLYQSQELIDKLIPGTMEIAREDIGRATPEFDIKAMQHEQLYSRLYMS